METIWYTEPSGNHLPRPSTEQMLEFMRQDYAENWGPFSPVAVLCWHEHPRRKVPTRVGLGTATERQQLLLTRHPKRGWYLEYSTANMPQHRRLVPLDAAANSDVFVHHWAYGEQVYFLAACFVPQPVAEQVVLDFLATREPSPIVTWVEFESVRPRFDSVGYRERRRQKKGHG